MNIHCPIDRRDELERFITKSSAATHYKCSDLAQFSNLFDGLQLEGIQLSPGKFDGSVVLATMEDASIHISQSVHAIEMRMKVNPDRFLVCVCLCEDSDDMVFGARDPGSWLFLLPPGGCAAMPAPENCTLVTLSIASKAIVESEFLGPDIRAWFSKIRPEGIFLRSKHLASRVREDITLAFWGAESGAAPGNQKSDQSVCQAMLSSIMSAFSLEWLVHDGIEVDRRATATDRYFRARHLICAHDFTNGDGLNDALSRLGSARSVEQAFSSHVKMGAAFLCARHSPAQHAAKTAGQALCRGIRRQHCRAGRVLGLQPVCALLSKAFWRTALTNPQEGDDPSPVTRFCVRLQAPSPLIDLRALRYQALSARSPVCQRGPVPTSM